MTTQSKRDLVIAVGTIVAFTSAQTCFQWSPGMPTEMRVWSVLIGIMSVAFTINITLLIAKKFTK